MNTDYKQVLKSLGIKEIMGQRILVKPLKKDGTTKTGIIIPSQEKELSIKAEIIALGDEVDTKGDFQCGDIILFSAFEGINLMIKNFEYNFYVW